MPKIPQLRENQRVQLQSPVQAVSANTEEAAAMEGLGRSLAGAAQTFARLNQERDRNNRALIAQRFKNKMELAAQNAHKELETGNEVAPDGSNYTALFEKKVAGVLEEAKDIGGDLGVVAENAATQVFLSHRSKNVNKEVALYNQFQFTEVEKIMGQASDVVANDPSLYQEKLFDLSDTIQGMAISRDNKNKMVKAVRKDLQASVLSSMMEQGKFNDAREFVEEVDATGEERAKLMEDIEKNESEYKSDEWNEETRKYQRMKREKEEARIENTSEVWDMVSSTDPTQRSLGLKQARQLQKLGVFTPSDVNAFEVQSEDIYDEISQPNFLAYTRRLVDKENLKSFRDDVMGAVRNKWLKPEHARALMKEYATTVKSKRGTNRTYTERKQIGDRLMRNAYQADFLEDYDEDQKADRLGKYARTESIAADLRAQGVDPVKAAYRAIKIVQPSNSILHEEGIVSNKQQAPEDILKQLDREAKKLLTLEKKYGSQMSPEQFKKLQEEKRSLVERRNRIINRRDTRRELEEEMKEQKRGK